jgi:allophanate hydrolase subunit 1
MSNSEWTETYVKLSEVEEKILNLNQRIADLQSEVTAANNVVASAEAHRPLWAMGYTSDSIAAQSTSAALTQIWKAIGAKDQTDAMRRLELMNGLLRGTIIKGE